MLWQTIVDSDHWMSGSIITVCNGKCIGSYKGIFQGLQDKSLSLFHTPVAEATQLLNWLCLFYVCLFMSSATSASCFPMYTCPMFP